jgi:hypothetical protein
MPTSSAVANVISILAAVSSLALATLGWKKESSCHQCNAGKWSELVQAYQQLWNQVSDGSISASELRAELRRLAAIKVIADRGEPLIRIDERVRSRCFDQVLQTRGLL